MVESGSRPGAGDSPGILHSLKMLSATWASAFHTRVDLFVTELEEERERFKQTLVLALLVVFGFGIILLTIFLVALFWQNGWIGAIGGLAVVYLGVATIAAFKLRNIFFRRSGLFPATLAELAKDRDRLQA